MKLIDATQIPFSPTAVGIITTPLMVNSVPTVDAIPRERIEHMIAEIEESKKSCVILGLTHRANGLNEALGIIKKYTKENNYVHDF